MTKNRSDKINWPPAAEVAFDRECAKLDPAEEQSFADLGFQSDFADWPDYAIDETVNDVRATTADGFLNGETTKG